MKKIISESQARLLTGKFGSPLFVVFKRTIIKNIEKYRKVYGSYEGGFTLAYSVKTNSIVEILRSFRENNVLAEVCSGNDITGALLAGYDGNEIIYAGLVKTDEDLEKAVRHGFRIINIESLREAQRLEKIAQKLNRKVNVGIRLSFPSPMVGFKSLLGLSYDRFGLSTKTQEAQQVAKLVMESNHLKLIGLHIHTGSSQKSSKNYLIGINELVNFMVYLKAKYGLTIELLNLGGGLGVEGISAYKMSDFGKQALSRLFERHIEYKHHPMKFELIAEQILGHLVKKIKKHGLAFPHLMMEPGASLIGDSVHLISSIIELKQTEKRRWMILDAGTNLLPVLTLYSEYHDVEVLNACKKREKVSIAGPLLYSADVVAHDRYLPKAKVGDLVVLHNMGAYFGCQSNQFLYPRPATIMMNKKGGYLIQHKETHEDVFIRDTR